MTPDQRAAALLLAEARTPFRTWEWDRDVIALLRELAAEQLDAERERCAKVCEALIRRQAHVNPAAAWYEATHSCAAAIRGA